ncbi:ATP-binding protein [Candidatus Woesearchaeota archaeon]|nr:ATP-binding protein [Candidatus Woesearchaeota archaeon]
MVYKICLSATQGTGKTTLATLVAGELRRRTVETRTLPEMSTLAREKGLPINEQTSRETQLWILYAQFAEELTYHARTAPPRYDVIICDRGVDNYCYLERRFGRDEQALRLVQGHLLKYPYNQIYVLPIITDDLPEGEGVRSTNHQFQQEMDAHIRRFFQEQRISYVDLPKPQSTDHFREEWVRTIVNQTLIDLGKEHLQMR